MIYSKEYLMQIISLILGILVIMGMLVALIPFLGWMNWGVIPLAIAGLIISIIATATAKETRGPGIAGIVLCVIAAFIGTIRLFLGGGIL
jgi:peptidoglycan/LPS O-acetylase OafA/YrhL